METMTPSQQSLTIRYAADSDAPALRELAQLDSRRLPAGPHLVAEIDDRIRAVYSITTTTAIADPFFLTDDLVELLRTYARAEAPKHRSRLGRVSVRAALA